MTHHPHSGAALNAFGVAQLPPDLFTSMRGELERANAAYDTAFKWYHSTKRNVALQAMRSAFMDRLAVERRMGLFPASEGGRG